MFGLTAALDNFEEPAMVKEWLQEHLMSLARPNHSAQEDVANSPTWGSALGRLRRIVIPPLRTL